MLMRLVTAISLILFMLLLISGSPIDVALYRSMIVFMALFSVIYLSLFFLNVIKGKAENETSSAPGESSQHTNT